MKLRFQMNELLAINDPRELPAYSVQQASHYLRLPVSTLRAWIQGRNYPVHGGQKRSNPLIQLPDSGVPLLSFYNLAEAHVRTAFRRDYEIPMQAVKTALDYVIRKFGCDHPLIQQDFKVHGAKLLVQKLDGELVEASGGGQKMLACVNEHLRRIEWEDKFAARLYPFTRRHIADAPKMVLIDPRVSFGQPFLAASRVPTAVIADRYKAGDSVNHLARDYACKSEEIEEAIRCELDVPMAA